MAYDLPQSTITLASQLVPIPFPLAALKSIELDPGSKRKLVAGSREKPLYVIRGSAEPKLKIDFTDATEYRGAWQSVGGASIGRLPCAISAVLLDIATGNFEFWMCTGIVVPAPGFKLDDSGFSQSVEFMPTDVLFAGQSIYPTN
jgi:hypothetical protein